MNIPMLLPVLPEGEPANPGASPSAEVTGLSFAVLFAMMQQQIADAVAEAEAVPLTSLHLENGEADDALILTEGESNGPDPVFSGTALIPENPMTAIAELTEPVSAATPAANPAEAAAMSDYPPSIAEESKPQESSPAAMAGGEVAEEAAGSVSTAATRAMDPSSGNSPLTEDENTGQESSLSREPKAPPNGKTAEADTLRPPVSADRALPDTPESASLREPPALLAALAGRTSLDSEAEETAAALKAPSTDGRHVTTSIPKADIETVGLPANANRLHETAPPAPPDTEAPVRATLETIEPHTVRGVRYLLARGERTLTVRLSPESLGELRIEIHTKGDELSIRLASANPIVRDALENQAGTLREALTRGGIEAAKLEITANLGHHTGNEGQPGRETNQEHTPLRGMPHGRPVYSTPAAGQTGALRPTRHEGVLNVFV